jgi:hypothetical protein
LDDEQSALPIATNMTDHSKIEELTDKEPTFIPLREHVRTDSIDDGDSAGTSKVQNKAQRITIHQKPKANESEPILNGEMNSQVTIYEIPARNSVGSSREIEP